MSGRQKEVVFVKTVQINKIRIDGGTQIRLEISEETVADYADRVEELPPVDIYFDGNDYWLADGFHRYFAHKRAGKVTIQAKVHDGDARAARLRAIGANCEHGLRRSNADKRNAVAALLQDAEWRKQKQPWMAQHAGVTQQFVSKVISERREEEIKAQKDTKNANIDAPTYNSCTSEAPCVGDSSELDGLVEDVVEGMKPPEQRFSEDERRRQEGIDQVGHKLPDDEKIAEAFAQVPVFRSLMARVSQLKGEFEQIMDGPAGSWPTRHRQEWAAAVDHLHSIIRFCIPHSVCPYCGGQSQKCDACFRSGYMPQDVWKRVPGDVKGNLEPEEAAA